MTQPAREAPHGAGFGQSPRVREDGLGELPPMVSYAQNFEDVVLRRALQEIEAGFYVDIGAWDPTLDSVTAWFYGNGWSGINVEPNPAYFAALDAARPRDRNLCAVVGASGGLRDVEIAEGTGLSSGIPGGIDASGYAGRAPRRTVAAPQIALADVLAAAGGRTIDFLKIDAKGMEAEILSGGALGTFRPRVLVVEATAPTTQLPSHAAWEPGVLINTNKIKEPLKV